MSKWAQAKQQIDLDWRVAWREIEAGTRGELASDVLAEAVALVNQMDTAYHRRDKAGFLAVRSQLVKHRSWTGSSGICNVSPAAGSVKPTAPATQLDCLI